MGNRLEQLDDNTLFEVFAETSNHLNGVIAHIRLRALERGDEMTDARMLGEALRMHREYRETGADDRERQIRLIEEWDARARELEASS